jgi:hypothetical protein
MNSDTNKDMQDDPDDERIFFFDEELMSKQDTTETPKKYLKQQTRLEKKLEARYKFQGAKL